jgi:flagellar basal body-associated protein FliL
MKNKKGGILLWIIIILILIAVGIGLYFLLGSDGGATGGGSIPAPPPLPE